MSKSINNKGYKTPKVSLKVNSKVIGDICYTKSFVDVLWEVCKLLFQLNFFFLTNYYLK